MNLILLWETFRQLFAPPPPAPKSLSPRKVFLVTPPDPHALSEQTVAALAEHGDLREWSRTASAGTENMSALFHLVAYLRACGIPIEEAKRAALAQARHDGWIMAASSDWLG